MNTDRPQAISSRSLRLGVRASILDGVIVEGDIAIDGDEVVDVGLRPGGEGIAIPALVDPQVNGYAGIDVLTADTAALVDLGRALKRDGVFAYQPTLITSSEEQFLAAIARIESIRGVDSEGAAITGIHLEGPFLSHSRSGAHPAEHLRSPDQRLLERLLDAGPVRMVTLAPELPGALELITSCVRRGLVVSLGHSAASEEETHLAFQAGATATTHLFNAMDPISARSPGLAGRALITPGVTLQLIADGVHVSDSLLRLAFTCAPDRCSLVSDAIAATGLGDGSFRLGAIPVDVRGGIARRADGRLAGSAHRLSDGLTRLIALALPLPTAVAAATTRPGQLVSDGRYGVLRRGGKADVVVVDDNGLIQRIIAAGRELSLVK